MLGPCAQSVTKCRSTQPEWCHAFRVSHVCQHRDSAKVGWDSECIVWVNKAKYPECIAWIKKQGIQSILYGLTKQGESVLYGSTKQGIQSVLYGSTKQGIQSVL